MASRWPGGRQDRWRWCDASCGHFHDQPGDCLRRVCDPARRAGESGRPHALPQRRRDRQAAEQQYEEAPVAFGLQSNGNLLQVYASTEKDTWTVVSTTPNGMSCIVAAGKKWESLPLHQQRPDGISRRSWQPIAPRPRQGSCAPAASCAGDPAFAAHHHLPADAYCRASWRPTADRRPSPPVQDRPFFRCGQTLRPSSGSIMGYAAPGPERRRSSG